MANPGDLVLRVITIEDDPPEEKIDIELRHNRLSTERKVLRDINASEEIKITGLRTRPDGMYKLGITARSFQPHWQFVSIRSDDQTDVEVILERSLKATRRAKEILERAMNYPIDDVITRHASDHDLPREVVEEQGRELKRFLALVAITNEPYGLSGATDKLWHTFVLFTKIYTTFCDEVAGHFIHHFPRVPNPVDPDLDRAGLKESYLRFLRDYETIIGEVPPVHIWPRPTPESNFKFDFANCGAFTTTTEGQIESTTGAG